MFGHHRTASVAQDRRRNRTTATTVTADFQPELSGDKSPRLLASLVAPGISNQTSAVAASQSSTASLASPAITPVAHGRGGLPRPCGQFQEVVDHRKISILHALGYEPGLYPQVAFRDIGDGDGHASYPTNFGASTYPTASPH